MGRRELVIYECDGYHPEGACESGEPIGWVGVRDGGPDNEPNVLVFKLNLHEDIDEGATRLYFHSIECFSVWLQNKLFNIPDSVQPPAQDKDDDSIPF